MDRYGYCVERLPSQPIGIFGRKSDCRYTPYLKTLKSHYPKLKFQCVVNQILFYISCF